MIKKLIGFLVFFLLLAMAQQVVASDIKLVNAARKQIGVTVYYDAQ
jgi:uncharacterized protein YijF (DUF1287 family)